MCFIDDGLFSFSSLVTTKIKKIYIFLSYQYVNFKDYNLFLEIIQQHCSWSVHTLLRSSVHTHLERLVLEVHLEQRVSHQVSEATAVEVTVRPCVTSVVVDLRELQATKLVEVISMEILVLAEHLLTKTGSTSVSTELLAQR